MYRRGGKPMLNFEQTRNAINPVDIEAEADHHKSGFSCN
jgi:hypothetical protein